MTYLVDTSALVRILRRQVHPRWYDQVAAGQIAICDPVITETLAITDAAQTEAVEAGLRAAYPWVPVPADVWETVAAVRRRLAAAGVHQGLTVADHLVVATALRNDLAVLHEDPDFGTVARYVAELRQERITGRG